MKFCVVALMFFAISTQAQTGDWARVQSMGRGTTLIVETDVNPYGPAAFTRCHPVSADASTLTCRTLGWAGKTVVFPVSRIDVVYRVKPHTVKAVLGIAAVGMLVGGLIARNGDALAIGFGGSVVWLLADGFSRAAGTWRSMTGNDSPLPPDERRELLYLCPAPPVATN